MDAYYYFTSVLYTLINMILLFNKFENLNNEKEEAVPEPNRGVLAADLTLDLVKNLTKKG